MDALKAINTRRSIRNYKDRKVPAHLIKELLNAGRNAPSAFNEQPWVFIIVTKQETKDEIAFQKRQKSSFISKTPLLIACCYDKKKSRAAAHNLENVALAAENILIAANASGLGGCYIGAFDPEHPDIEEGINKALKLPNNILIVCLLSIGYPDGKPVKKELRPLNETVHEEFYHS
ncbi:hypothetical protein COS64_03415 [archaeon CG06_land_8_20_14_3_00_37_11]|nr:MAG: hypothetical protein COS64_03415 [archaeon CG06_land_8_20_14_3_00_37_11]